MWGELDEIEGGCLHKETQWGVMAFGSILLSDYLGCGGKDNNYYVLHILKLLLRASPLPLFFTIGAGA